jgi:hypothetical protein
MSVAICEAPKELRAPGGSLASRASAILSM